MAARPIPEQVLADTLAAVRTYGTISAAADALGVNRLTFSHRFRVAQAAKDAGERLAQASDRPNDQREEPHHEQRKAGDEQHPRVHSLPPSNCRIGRVTYKDEGRVRTVLAFSDSHDKPGRCKERFRWFGRLAADIRPDAIVALGDTASLDSLSTHEVPGSASDLAKPPFWEELNSLDEALSLFHEDLPVGSIPIHHPHGNHENRAWLAANRQPKQCGDLPMRVDGVFARYQWQTRPYGSPLELFGVQWVHTILNKMGRPSNGEFPEQLHGKKQVRDLVLAHTHTHNVVTVAKNAERVKVVNLGCSMPWGMREVYTPETSPPWDYGVCVIRIKGGQIISTQYRDMLELASIYGS